MGPGQVGGEYSRAQPVFGGIGPGQNLGLGLKIQNRQDRAEDFLADDGHGIGHIGKHRGFDEKPRSIRAAASCHQPGTFADPLGNKSLHNAALPITDHRAERGGGVQRIADDDGFQPRRQARQKRGLDAPLHKNPRPVGTYLAGRVEIGEDRPRYRTVQIGIVKNHQGRFAAQFHRHMLHPRCRRRIDAPPGGHRSGQRHLGDAGVGNQGSAHGPHPLNDIVNPRRGPGLVQDFRDFQGTERGGFGWLEDHRIATGQRRRSFPGGNLGGVIPRPDPDADTQWFPPRIGKIGPQLDMLAGQRPGQPAEIFQRVSRTGRIGHQRFRQRLAGVHRLQHRQVMVAGADDVGCPLQHPSPLGTGPARPVLLRTRRGGQRLFDDRRGGCMDAGDDSAGGRIDHVDGFTCGVLDISAVDEMAGGGLGGIGHFRTLMPPAGIFFHKRMGRVLF